MPSNEVNDMHDDQRSSTRRKPRPGDRGVAIVMALVAVGAATLLGLALASQRALTTDANDSISRTAAAGARSTSRSSSRPMRRSSRGTERARSHFRSSSPS
jgi:hypothetical protein